MAKKSNNGMLKTFLFWVIQILAIVGVLMVLNGPVGAKNDDEVIRMSFEAITKGQEGLDLGILGSVGKVEGTFLPVVAVIAGALGLVVAFGGHLFVKAKKMNLVVLVGAALLVVAGVLVFFSANAFVGANEGFEIENYALTKWGIMSGIFMIASGAGFGVGEFLL